MTSLFKELEQARARVTALELKAEQERRDVLATLPAQYGFASFEDFADAVREANGLIQGRPSIIAGELVAGEADNPYWRDTPVEAEVVPSTFVAQGIQASRSAQASRSGGDEGAPSSTASTNAAPERVTAPVEDNSSSQTATSDAAPGPAPRPLPTGTSLSDPSQFGLLPDNSLLERGDKTEETFRAQLNAANIFSQQVLHTSRVPAAVWREWRDFGRKAADALRGGVPIG